MADNSKWKKFILKREDLFMKILQQLEPGQFVRDCLIPDNQLFGVHPTWKGGRPLIGWLAGRECYRNGRVFVQDKASCLPAIVLDPPAGAHVVDCCAAPGNKTIHLAGLFPVRKVYAFDRDRSRYETLVKRCQLAGVANKCKFFCQDFLEISPDDRRLRKVEYALVDPSCSGSGIHSDLDGDSAETDETLKERLKKLSSFQLRILEATAKLPNIRRIVYSTCSVYQVENEQVVDGFLSTSIGSNFQLVDALDHVDLDTSYRSDSHPKCLRFDGGPAVCGCAGFFLACFQRVA